MLVLHNGAGVITGLQLFPLTTDAMHIVVSDDLFPLLSPFISEGLQLESDGQQFFISTYIYEKLNELILEKARTEKFTEIESAQATELKAGALFDFNGVPDVIQTRTERDLINISGIAMRGMLMQGGGVTDAVIEFRAQSNTSYMITPAQAVALGETVAQHSEAIYSKAWTLKDAIQSATTLAALEVITW